MTNPNEAREREAFEKYIRERAAPNLPDLTRYGEAYLVVAYSNEWYGWQARASLEATSSAPIGGSTDEEQRAMRCARMGIPFFPSKYPRKGYAPPSNAPATAEPAPTLASLRGMAAENLQGRTSEQIVEGSRAQAEARAPISDERAAFEAWVTSQACRLIPAGQQWDGIRCEVAWEAWQARAVASASQRDSLVEAARAHIESLDAYEEDLVPINRTRGTAAALRAALPKE